MDQYALWIGRIVMAAAGGVLALLLLGVAWWFTGILGAEVFKRVRRIYHLRVIGYWLDKLEKEGPRVFEKAQQEDAAAQWDRSP